MSLRVVRVCLVSIKDTGSIDISPPVGEMKLVLA